MAAPTAQRNDSGVSPSSSPRLPSPPPFTEVQIGPKSPSVTGGISEFSLDAGKIDDGASRRIRPGTKAADMAKGPPFVPLHQLESAFQLQEYLQALYAKLTRDEASNTVKPVDKEIALELSTPPIAQDTNEPVERNLWLYELCRFLCNKTTRMIVGFFKDNPPCSSQTCPEMRASEWQYLCAVHDPPKSCCAIDYCNHTLDWASNILSSNKHFPSRLSLSGEGGNAYQSMRQLTNIFRRVYRIYAHAWFQHREVFWEIEAENGLYLFFKTVCDQYSLIPEDNYTIPPEAEGEPEEKSKTGVSSPEKTSNISILQKSNDDPEQSPENQASVITTGATTRRHKHTPSTGVPVSVIAEGQEEEEEDETTMLDLGAPGPAQETSSSLSPPKPRIDRAKSPGLIEIPKNIDPERVPEDPTPVAAYGSNPFGSPGPTDFNDSSSNSSGVATPESPSDPGAMTAFPTLEEEVSIEPDTIPTRDSPEPSNSASDHVEETHETKAHDNDDITEVVEEHAEASPKHEDDKVEKDEIAHKVDPDTIPAEPTDDSTTPADDTKEEKHVVIDEDDKKDEPS